jgi:ubiquitin-conjugating enzyme E2 M
MRISRDFETLDGIPSWVTIDKNHPDFPMKFSVEWKVGGSSYWRGGLFKFNFSIPPDYPFSPPEVLLDPEDKIYHPHIDLEGNICVSALRPWKPNYTLEYICQGIQFLFDEPNPEDIINIPAGNVMRSQANRADFIRNVNTALAGGRVAHDSLQIQFKKNRGNVVR